MMTGKEMFLLMKGLLIGVLVGVFLAYLAGVAGAQAIPGNPPIFAPVKPNAYGPGINADATGRPFSWSVPGTTIPDVTLRVQPNAYGYGLGHDQYGRPAVPADPYSGVPFGFGQTPPRPAAPQSGGFWMTVPDGRLFNPETGEWRQGK